MSVILDALKKLDREKSSRRNGSTNIAVEILRPDLPRAGKKVIVYFAIVSLATAVITYAVVVKFSSLPKSLPESERPPALIQQVSPAPPEPDSVSKPLPPAAVSPPAPSQPVSPAPSSRKAVRETRDEAVRAPTKIQGDAEIKTPATSPGEKERSEEVIPAEVALVPGDRERRDEVILTEPVRSSPSLRISGIVWNEEPSRRLAVINGAIITEGSMIEGVKVVEIHPTFVRFSKDDRSFEISLGSSLVPSHESHDDRK